MFPDCIRKAECSCFCASQSNFMCLNHIFYHIAQNPSICHILEEFFKNSGPQPPSEEEAEIKSKISILAYQKSNLLKHTYEKVSETLKILEKNLDCLDQMTSKYFHILDEKKPPKLEGEAEVLNEPSIRNIFTLSDSIKHEIAEVVSTFRYFDIRFPKSLMITNSISLKTSQKPLNLPENMYYGINTCLLPNKSVFCFENCINWFYPGLTFILDSSNNMKIIKSGTPSFGAGSVYLDGCVYIIGAWDSITGTKIYCEKYDLSNKYWTKLTPTENPGYWHSCTVFSRKILYSGNDIDLFLYDHLTDSHSSLLSFDTYKFRHKNKILFSHNERAYIAITDKEVYESCANDPYNWTVLIANLMIPTNGLISYITIVDDTASMIFEDYFIYKLDLKGRRTRRVVFIE
ncbi:unnamed protein product [Blepharisma stoltei]|uniref:Uncharacterized protein n=1 Tax=Blepharisma stoltei TaxID=1481888 RepID=A0AAU9JUV8_9CILI|nr:unnamed protein product [Blepharisma stoltei]